MPQAASGAYLLLRDVRGRRPQAEGAHAHEPRAFVVCDVPLEARAALSGYRAAEAREGAAQHMPPAAQSCDQDSAQ
jgi:hypothetical protein